MINLISMSTRQRKSILRRRLCELAMLAGHREEIEIEYAADPLDKIRSRVDRDIAVCQINQHERAVQEVIEALTRLDQGGYGVCAQCEQPISAKRLAAVPWVRLCIACQEKAESRPVRPELRFHAAA